MGGAEVREASHPSWGETGSTVACRFLKIKTGPETARLCGGWCPPTPHSNCKVFPSSSKHMQSNSGQYLIFEKGGRIKRNKKKNKNSPPSRKLQPCTASTHNEDNARATGTRTQRSQFPRPRSEPSCRRWPPPLCSGPLAAGRILWKDWGGGPEEGAGGRAVQGRGGRRPGKQCRPLGWGRGELSLRPGGGESLRVAWPLRPCNGGGGNSGVRVAWLLAVTTLARGN